MSYFIRVRLRHIRRNVNLYDTAKQMEIIFTLRLAYLVEAYDFKTLKKTISKA